MQSALIFLLDYSWISLWWLFSLLIGSAMLLVLGQAVGREEMHAPNRELNLFFSMAAGIAAQIMVLIVIAQAQLLTPVMLSLAVILVGGAALMVLSRNRRAGLVTSMFRWPGWSGMLHAAPLLLLLLAWVVRPLGPPQAHDEISYHLPYARFYLEHGGLAVHEYLRFPLQTHNFNLLYSVALLGHSASLPHLVHATAGFLVMLGVHGLARHWLGWGGAFIAVLGVMMVGTFQFAFADAFVDLGYMLYITACLFALAIWHEHRDPAWLWLAGALLGTALGVKYLALTFTVPLLVWVLWRGRNWRDPVRFVAASCAFGLFWYVRSWWISGNPVHPFLGEWFGYYIWSPSEVQAQMTELKNHGIDRTVHNFLRLPEQLLNERKNFHGYRSFDGLLMGGFYLGLLGLYWMRPALRAMALVSLAYLLFWFSSAHVMRYLLPIVPVMALVTGSWLVLIGRLVSQWLPVPKVRSKVRFPLAQWVMVLLALGISARILVGDVRRIAITPAEQDTWLREHKEGYELLLNAAADPRIGAGPLLQFGLEGSFFYFPGTLLGDWTGHFAYTRFMEWSASGYWQLIEPRTLRERLRAQGIRGVVFRKDSESMFYPSDLPAYEQVFELIFENRFGIVMVPRD